MARRSVPAKAIDLEPIIEQLGEVLCVVEVAINSLDAAEQAGPELPALQCALRGLNSVHARLAELHP